MNDKQPKTGRPGAGPVPGSDTHAPDLNARHRAQFAKEMARSVFGRSYWDDAMETEKRVASLKPRGSKK